MGGAVSLSEADAAAHVLADRRRPVCEMQLYVFPRMPSDFGIVTCCVILAEVCVCVGGSRGASYVFGAVTRVLFEARESLP